MSVFRNRPHLCLKYHEIYAFWGNSGIKKNMIFFTSIILLIVKHAKNILDCKKKCKLLATKKTYRKENNLAIFQLGKILHFGPNYSLKHKKKNANSSFQIKPPINLRGKHNKS